MPFVEKRLISPTSLTTSASSALYTVPAGYTAIVKQIVVTNTTGTAATFTMYIGAASAGNALFSGTSVAANDTVIINLSQVLGTGEILRALSGTNAALNLTVSGVENDGPLAQNAMYIADNAITSAKIADGAIVNADINASAAIDQSKIASLTSDLALKAPLASPALTGTPLAPTATTGTNTTQLATTAFVTAADALAGGLVLVASATFTTATTASINNCFTSTYDNYRVVISGFSTSSTNANILMRFRNAGADRATQYMFAMRGLDAGNASKDDYNGGYGTFGFFGSSPVYAGDVTSSTWDVYTPATANRSYLTFTTAYYPGAFAVRTGMIAHDSTVSNDGFTVWPTNGTVSGNIRVYGYRN
jgi:hypothetical protein